MSEVIKFPSLKKPTTLDELKRRILSDCEDIEMGATASARGSDFIMEDIIYFLKHIGVDTENL